MRGERDPQSELFTAVSPESRVREDHPIRIIKKIVDEEMQRLSKVFDGMYSHTGRPSVPPEVLLKSMLLMALYGVSSERLFCERLEYDLLFRYFLDMGLD